MGLVTDACLLEEKSVLNNHLHHCLSLTWRTVLVLEISYLIHGFVTAVLTWFDILGFVFSQAF